MDLIEERLSAQRLAAQQTIAMGRLEIERTDRGVGPAASAATPMMVTPPTMAVRGSGTDPCWWSVTEMVAAFRSDAASPLSVLEAIFERIRRVDPALHSFVHVDHAGAIAAARDPDLPRGPLFGIPVGVKDVIDVAGLPTTCHSRLRLGSVASRDAAVIRSLRAAGAIIVGKLATHEFAIGGPSFDLPFPPARNPWNLNHHPGGSSSGAGAAVAAGLVPLAIGTDTAGSVRNPASACGIVGIKPTRDLLPLDGVVPLAPSLDHLGILGRSVDDVRIALEALAAISPAGCPAPRIGYIRHFHVADMPADLEVCAALDCAASILGAKPANLPPLDAFALVNRIILQCEGYAYHAENLQNRPEAFAKRTRSALLPGAYAAPDYPAACKAHAALTKAVDACFAEFDVLLTASSMTTPCRIEDDTEIDRTYLRQARTVFNLTGHPALAMASGISISGLPLSLQLAARRGEESLLLDVAAQWEAALGGPPRPPLA
jgi:aspartyl-tRNA(Asn)/glutamyl-tRNA(Gln) amidotransferase subunit A